MKLYRIEGWYFSPQDCRLAHGDGRLVEAGVTHSVSGELELCGNGLHFSVSSLNALDYAPSPIVWRVNVFGNIIKSYDKGCARERGYLWGYDATKVLRHFARLCALDVVHLWNAPDVAIRFLRTGDESLRAATRAAARTATRAAAGTAARNAAGTAARNAAGNTARTAARDAARAARDAARDAARAATREAQNRRLHRMLMEGRP